MIDPRPIDPRPIDPRPIEAVLLDFYGTLARATRWVSIEEVLGEHGASMPEDAVRRYFEGHDGEEHLESSRSREHYVAWQRDRMLAMLADTDVHPGEHEEIVAKLRHGTATRVLERYPEVPEVLEALRASGLRLAVCSNWDWDLDDALGEAGLGGAFDVVVSSAWVGARKPHPRIFQHTLDQLDCDPGDALFVGDTWGPDVDGPRAIGMRAAYLERDGHWPDPGAPPDPDDRSVASRITDLRGLRGLLGPRTSRATGAPAGGGRDDTGDADTVDAADEGATHG